MIDIRELIDKLKEFQSDSMCYAYEWEQSGLVIVDPDGKEIGFVPNRGK